MGWVAVTYTGVVVAFMPGIVVALILAWGILIVAATNAAVTRWAVIPVGTLGTFIGRAGARRRIRAFATRVGRVPATYPGVVVALVPVIVVALLARGIVIVAVADAAIAWRTTRSGGIRMDASPARKSDSWNGQGQRDHDGQDPKKLFAGPLSHEDTSSSSLRPVSPLAHATWR